jgi:hypothetical protein
MRWGVPSHDLLDALVAEEVALGEGTQHVVVDQFEDLLFLRILLQRRVLDIGVHHHEIFLPLADQRLQLVVLVRRDVFQQDLPRLRSEVCMGGQLLWGMPFQESCFNFSRSTMLELSSVSKFSRLCLEELYSRFLLVWDFLTYYSRLKTLVTFSFYCTSPPFYFLREHSTTF